MVISLVTKDISPVTMVMILVTTVISLVTKDISPVTKVISPVT